MIKTRTILFSLVTLCVAAAWSPCGWANDVDALVEHLGADDAEVRAEASDTLADMGAEVIAPLRKVMEGDNRTAALWAENALKRMAHHAGMQSGEARARITNEWLQVIDSDEPVERKRLAYRLLPLVASGSDAVSVLLQRMQHDDERELARRVLEVMPGRIATQALIIALTRPYEPSVHAAIIDSLGVRGDALATAAILQAMESDDAAIRASAVEAAGQLRLDPGDDADAIRNALMEAWRSDDVRTKRAAADSLLRMAERWSQEGQEEAARVIYRALHIQTDSLLVQGAALLGLSAASGDGAITESLAALASPHRALRGAAMTILAQTPGEAITSRLVDELEGAEGAQRLTLLEMIGERGDAAAAQAVPYLLAIALEESGDAQRSASETLVRLPSESVTETLIEHLPDASMEGQEVLLRILGERGDEVGLPILRDYATRSNEGLREAALTGLRQIAGADDAPLLRLAFDSDNIDIRNAAARAAMSAAMNLDAQGKNEEAVELCLAAIDAASNRGAVNALIQSLRRLGADQHLADFASRTGFITHWWLLGPLPDRNHLRENDALDPEASIDLSEPVEYRDETYEWRYTPITDPTGQLDLANIVGAHNFAGVYLYAEVTSEQELDAQFRIGSDDDFVCWLNGEEVGRFLGDRGWTPDQDVFDVTLQDGVNTVLLKVLNAEGGWGASLRITDREGNRLVLPQRTP